MARNISSDGNSGVGNDGFDANGKDAPKSEINPEWVDDASWEGGENGEKGLDLISNLLQQANMSAPYGNKSKFDNEGKNTNSNMNPDQR